MQDQFSKQGLSKAQKTGFVLLLIFAILAVGLGILQMRNQIYGPFVINLTKTDQQEASLFIDEETRLQSIDTDHDGLNDYEELNFYETSPYLPDSDSDGFKDKEEIEAGTDPLCPEGEVCASASVVPLATTTPALDALLNQEVVTPLDVLNMSGLGGDSLGAEDMQAILEDPDKLREVLIATGGITAEDLAKIDDQTLLGLAGEILQEQEL